MTKALIKVLLIEDNPADVLFLKESLRDDLLADFQVTVADHLKQGLAKLENENFDVLLLDLGLPDSQGIATFKIAHAEFPDMPVIVLSGMTDEVLALQAVQTGAQDYLVKGETSWGLGPRAIRYAIERHQVQSAVRASETRFSTIFRTSPTPTAITRLNDNKIMEVNGAWTQITGYSYEEIVGRTISELNLWANSDQREEVVRMIQSDGMVDGFEMQMRRRSGEIADLLFSAEIIELGGEPCMLSMALDITERKQIEAVIQEKERFIRATFDTLDEHICVLDENYIIISTNLGWRRYAEQNGHPHDDFTGTNYLAICESARGADAQDAARFSEGLQAVMRNEIDEFSMEYPCDSPAENHWFMTKVIPFPGEGARRLVVSHTDISAQKKSEAALRQSEERHRLISGLISDYAYGGVGFPDGTARTDWISGAFEQITGYTVDEIKNQPLGFASLLLPEDIKKVISQQHIFFEGKPLSIEYRIRRKNGEVRWLLDHMSSLPNESAEGEIKILGAVEDITERKKAELVLAENETKLKEAERNANLGYYEIDTLSGKTIWSDETYRIFGLKLGEYDPNVGDYGQFTHKDDTKKVFDLYDECTKNGKPFDLTYRIVRPSGEIRHVHSKSTFIADEQNNLTKLFGTLQDVTELVQAEEALKEGEEKFRTFIEQSTDGLAIFDEQGRVIEWNSAVEKISGLPKSQTLGLAIWDIQTMLSSPDWSPSRLESFKNGMLETLRTGQSPFFGKVDEDKIQTIFGEKKYIQQISFPIKSEKGFRIGAIIRDITERKQAEEMLHESEEQARFAHDAAELGLWREDVITSTYHLDVRARKHFDVDEASLPTKAISARVHPEDMTRLAAEMMSVLEQKDSDKRITLECRVFHRDKSVHWLAIYARLYFEERDGKPTAIFAAGTSQDITARKEAEQKLAQRTHLLKLIAEATRQLNISLKARHIYDVIYSSISQLMQCDTLFVSTYDPISKMITLSSGWHDGQPMDISNYEPIPLEPEGSGTQSQVIRSKESLLIHDFQARLKNTQVVHHYDGAENALDVPPEDGDIPRSALVVPLIVETEVFGVIQVFSYKANAFTEDDLETLNGFSSQAAISLSNAHLYEHVQMENLERKRAESALAESERRFRSIFETSEMGIFEVTPEGQIIHINPAYARMFGYESVQAAKEGITDISSLYVHPENRSKFVRNVLEHPGMASFENEYRHCDGTTFVGEIKLQAMKTSTGQSAYLFGYIENITSRKHAEIEARERNEELELINKLNEAVNRGESLDSVLELFARELGKISVCKDATIYLLSPDEKNLVMQHLTLPPALLNKIEKLIGSPIPRIEIPIKEGGYFHSALRSDQGILTTDPKIIQQWMEEFTETNYLPASLRGTVRKFIPQIYKLLNIRSTLILPLISDTKIIGLLDVSSAGILTEKDWNHIRKISGQVTAVILREQANEALLESEERYRAIFDGVQDAIFVETKDGRILEVNNSACEMYGYEREEFLTKTVSDFVLEGSAVFAPHLAPPKSQVTPFETINCRANGEFFPIEISGGILTINGEEVLLAIIRDITERKKAGEALRESEQKYRVLFNEMLSGVAVHEIICDPQGKPIDYRYIAINSAFEKMTGLVSDEVIGKTVLEIMPGTEAHWIERYGQVALTREPIQFENYAGELAKYFEVRAFSPEKGKFATIFNDVTERKHAELALKDSEALFRLLAENSTDMISSHDLQGVYNYVSPACRSLLGYEPEELIGRSAFEFVHSDDLSMVEQSRSKIVNTNEITTSVYRAHCKNGHYVWLETVSHAVVDQNTGANLEIHAATRDVTARKITEETLRISEERYTLINNSSLDSIYSYDTSGRFTSANRNLCETLKLSPDQIIGHTHAELGFPEALCEEWDNLHQQVYQTNNTVISETYAPLSDGSIRNYEVVLNPMHDIHGNTIGIGGTTRDITERKKAEEALRESRLLFSLLIETLPQNIYAKDMDGRFIFANQHYCSVQGRPLEEIIGKTDFELHPIELAKKYILDDRQVIQTGETIELEEEHQPLGKEKFFVQVIKTPFYYSAGKAAGILGIFWDITERKKTEENIRHRMLDLELLYENGLVFSQLLNPKQIAQKVIELLGEKLNWHHTAIRLVRGQDELELVAFDQPGLKDEAEQHKIKARFNSLISRIGDGLSGWALQESRIIRTGDVSSDPHYVATYPGLNSGLYVPLKSGDRILGVISIESQLPNAFSEADEKLIATLANQAANAFENARLYEELNHYTEELEHRVRERTAEIESTRRRLELAVKTAGIGIWELDIKQNKDYWDDGLFTLYGLSKESTSPSPQIWHKVLHPDDLALQLKLMDESLYNNQPYHSEFRVIWPDASVHHIKSTGIVILDEAGKPERMIGANLDITIHKLAEEALSFANAEMERGLRIKNEFLANMSHELRTPLNAILGISESLEEQISGQLNDKQLKYIRVITESGRHLLDMINDILDLSKIEAGKLELNIQPVSVDKLCTSSLRMVKELAQKKSLNVSFQVDENVKAFLGDERRLKQSLVNLLGNAVKFTPQGKNIGLEVRGNTETNEVTFTVWDEGIGITQEDMTRLFKPFVQLNASLTRAYAGTGLGLAVVAQIVRMHDGRIDLTSELNVGSRFTITLPWKPVEQEIQSTIRPQIGIDRSKTIGKRAGKILIVDDTEVVAQLMSEYLRHKGYQTIIAHDGREAVLAARQEHPQLIFMDVMMPVMNGLDATKHIRADATLKDIPIIALTALAMPDDREQCLAAGMNDYLSKPIQIQDLTQIIEQYLK
jgi:PAS domain S-box-containing protein